jgi:hypothetical protein
MSKPQSAQEKARDYERRNPAATYRETFLAGEISGYQRAMDEMSVKASEGFGEWWDGYIHADTFTHTAKDTWQAGRAPLLAKIELLSSRGIEDMRHTIAELEAQNKKLGDVVLEIYGIAWQRGRAAEDVGFITYHYFAKNQDLIKQLKQERGE